MMKTKRNKVDGILFNGDFAGFRHPFNTLLSKFNHVYTAFVPEPPSRIMKGKKMGGQKDEERNELGFDISANECFCLKIVPALPGWGISD